MTHSSSRSLVAPRTALTLAIALAATLALAVPPVAAQEDGGTPDGESQQDGETPQDGDRQDGPEERGNPVEHCLPDQARDGDDSTRGGPAETGTARAPAETGTARAPSETGTARRPETGTARRPETGTARSEVAQCVLDSLPDIVDNPHASSIVAAVTERIAQGHPDGTFRPQNPVSRAQMGTFLTRALDLEAPEEGVDAPDVDGDHPHAEGIAAVIDAGIALGKADGSFSPSEAVSRGQMATFLTRALGLTGEDGEVPEDTAGSVHEEAIGAVLDAEVAQGFPDGSFRPPAPVTRGQMATFLARGLGLGSSS